MDNSNLGLLRDSVHRSREVGYGLDDRLCKIAISILIIMPTGTVPVPNRI
jgi:hypothetical protein